MRLYKDSYGIFWTDKGTIPAGAYRLQLGANDKISIFSYDADTDSRLGAIYNRPLSDFLKEDNTPYADLDEFRSELSGLFKGEFDAKVLETVTQELGANAPYKVDIGTVDLDNSDFTQWTGEISDAFDGPFSPSITNATANNPKYFEVAFKYTIKSLQIGVGENNGGNFSNTKIVLIGSGGVERALFDETADDTKKTSLNVNFENEVFNKIRVEFHTDDPVAVSNILIYPSSYNTTQIIGKTPDGDFVNFNASPQGNFKVALSEYQGDAFGRLRVSEPYTIFDNSLTSQDSDVLFWSELLNGTASGAYQENTSSYLMSVASSGDYAVRQTKQRFKYQPGKSHEILMTGLLNTETDVIKCCGLLDYDNKGLATITNAPQNGVFFENNSGTLSYNIVNNGVVTESVSQENWNVDTCDGTGPSGFTLDINSTNIFFIDLEWLGVGAVRCGFVADDGAIVVAHQFRHASNSFTDVYMRTANLPVSYSIESTGGSGSMKQICSSVISEGGFNPKGIFRSIYTPAGVAVASNGKESILGMRLKEDSFEYTISVDSVSTLAASSGDGIWMLLYNPTLDGTPTWTDVPNSNIQASASNFDVLDDGIVFASGTYSSDNDASSANIESALRIGKDLLGNRDELWLCMFSFSSETMWGTIRFRDTL